MKKQTAFLPADLTAPEVLEAQVRWLDQRETLKHLLDMMPIAVLVLNAQRQTVYANRMALKWTGSESLETVLGARPGELLNCLHAAESPCACGTTGFCRYCGAARAIQEALQGRQAVQECRIRRRDRGAWDLRVWATPLTVNEQSFTVFAMVDIQDEKRRQALEYIFFHDVLNTASVLHNAVEMLRTAEFDEDVDELKTILYMAAERLIEEIKGQQTLLAAERGDLEADPHPISSRALLEKLARVYHTYSIAAERPIVIAPQSEEVIFVSDSHLVGRVLGNMIKNALEANKPGEKVTLTCRREEEEVVFAVHNPTPMSISVRHQVFNRSFSTKGERRGLGTYSMKLLTECYLGGKVWFTSTSDVGTTFFAAYPLSYPGRQC
ncbi:MAG: ATP-binding protein [Anaerolineae bacterium]